MILQGIELEKTQDQLAFEYNRREKFLNIARQSHELADIEIDGKTIKIDKEIIPVVFWLNSFANLKTQFSCQGELIPNGNHERPYVLFNSDNSTVEYLARIVNNFSKEKSIGFFICSYFEIEIHISFFDQIRYSMVWQDLIALQDFTEWLKNRGE